MSRRILALLATVLVAVMLAAAPASAQCMHPRHHCGHQSSMDTMMGMMM